ncbi:MAG: hypothetical protein QNK04_17400 [Myxococcota bacterium]|nr:hypothetical protein [Myxococcota bacterium]
MVWPGSLLHVALAELGLVVVVASRETAGEAVAAARSSALAQLLACVVVRAGAEVAAPDWCR